MLNEQTEFTGTVHQGVIVVDGGVELSEGQTVKIIVERDENSDSEPKPSSDSVPDISSAYTPLAKFMLSIAGTVDDWPPDFALNHDHYLYGADKRQ
jgi:hypothetical protein